MSDRVCLYHDPATGDATYNSRSRCGTNGLGCDGTCTELARLERELHSALDRAEKAERERDAVTACNEAMREPMMRLRALVGMPAQGEASVIDAVIASVARAADALWQVNGEMSRAREMLAETGNIIADRNTVINMLCDCLCINDGDARAWLTERGQIERWEDGGGAWKASVVLDDGDCCEAPEEVVSAFGYSPPVAVRRAMKIDATAWEAHKTEARAARLAFDRANPEVDRG